MAWTVSCLSYATGLLRAFGETDEMILDRSHILEEYLRGDIPLAIHTGQNPSDPLRVESSFLRAQIGFWNEMEQTGAKVRL